MKELKKVCSMLGTMLTKEELDMFMAEADAVSSPLYKFFVHLHLFCSHLLLLKMTQSQTD